MQHKMTDKQRHDYNTLLTLIIGRFWAMAFLLREKGYSKTQTDKMVKEFDLEVISLRDMIYTMTDKERRE